MDYATHYPEAVPLRKATSKNIARELVPLFCRFGLPKDMLTDQGTRFVSDKAKAVWEEQPSPFSSVIEYSVDMQQKIDL